MGWEPGHRSDEAKIRVLKTRVDWLKDKLEYLADRNNERGEISGAARMYARSWLEEFQTLFKEGE